MPQTLRSFQYRSGHEEPTSQDAAARTARSRRYGALGQINVVTLLFEGLGIGSRPQAIQAARDFLAGEAGPDTYIGVFRRHRNEAQGSFAAGERGAGNPRPWPS